MKLNVQFNDAQTEALESLASGLGTTRTGVIKTAIVLLSVAARERRAGNAIGIVNGDRVLREIEIVFA